MAEKKNIIVDPEKDFVPCCICGGFGDVVLTLTPVGDIDDLDPSERWFGRVDLECGECEARLSMSDYFPTAKDAATILVERARKDWNSRKPPVIK